MVNSEYMERDPPKVYPGCSGVYPYHPFPVGFAINQPSCRGAPSPPGISLQKGFRHIPGNYGPGNAASVSVSRFSFLLLINSRSTAVVGLKDLWSSLPAELKLFCSILLCSVLFHSNLFCSILICSVLYSNQPSNHRDLLRSKILICLSLVMVCVGTCSSFQSCWFIWVLSSFCTMVGHIIRFPAAMCYSVCIGYSSAVHIKAKWSASKQTNVFCSHNKSLTHFRGYSERRWLTAVSSTDKLS